MKKSLILALVAMAVGASAAAERCYEIADDPNGFDVTKFHYCDYRPSSIRLSGTQSQTYPDIYGASAGDLVPHIETESGPVPVTIASGWGGRGGFYMAIEDPSDALKLAEAINAGEQVDILITNTSTGTQAAVFSGVFGMSFPEDMIPGEAPEPEPEPAVEATPAPVVVLTPFQTDVLSAYDRLHPYNQWMDRDCVAAEADTVLAAVRDARLAAIDAEIARLQATITPDMHPRAVANIERMIGHQEEERARVLAGEAQQVKAEGIAGAMVSEGYCRDRQIAHDHALGECERAGRANCGCEADAFAENWLSKAYPTNSQGLVRMNVDARQACPN